MIQMNNNNGTKIECGICGVYINKASFIRHLKSKKCVSKKNKDIDTIPEEFKIDEDNQPLELLIEEMQNETIDVHVDEAVAKIEKVIADKEPTKIEVALDHQTKRKQKLESIFNTIWNEEQIKREERKSLEN